MFVYQLFQTTRVNPVMIPRIIIHGLQNKLCIVNNNVIFSALFKQHGGLP